MSRVTIRIYERDGSANQTDPVLFEIKLIETGSTKQLTAGRAAQLIKREFPDFTSMLNVLVIKTDKGWKATRTLRPVEGCSYHYIWQDIVVSESVLKESDKPN